MYSRDGVVFFQKLSLINQIVYKAYAFFLKNEILNEMIGKSLAYYKRAKSQKR